MAERPERTAPLVLPAHDPGTARVEVEAQPRAQRATRAALIAIASLILAPVAFFIPPHLLWPLLVLAAGGYFAYRTWVGEYIVRSFEGDCPRCGEPLTLEPGSRVRARHRVECYGCHREPELVLEPVGGETVAGDTAGSS